MSRIGKNKLTKCFQFRLDWETMWIEPCSDGDASHNWALFTSFSGDPTTISSTFQGMLDLKIGKYTVGIFTHAKMAVCFQRKTLSSCLACLATLPATPLTQPPNKINNYIPRAFFRINSPILPKSMLATFWTPFSIAFSANKNHRSVSRCPPCSSPDLRLHRKDSWATQNLGLVMEIRRQVDTHFSNLMNLSASQIGRLWSDFSGNLPIVCHLSGGEIMEIHYEQRIFHTESSIYTGVSLAMFDCQRVTINKMRDKAPSTFRYSHDKFSLLEGAPKL